MTWAFDLVAGPYRGRIGGLAWDGAAMLFSVVEEERILRYNPTNEKVDEFRFYTGRTNGLAIAADGSIYGAQEGGRRVIRFMPDGPTVPMPDLLEGRHHNQPTDVIVDSKGRVWFSDPHNSVPPFGPSIFPFLDHASILRIEKDAQGAWNLKRITYDTRQPRALVLSADEKTLFVADGEDYDGPPELRAYAVNADGGLGPCKVLHHFPARERGIEGLCLDSEGNLIACGGWKKNGPGPMVYVFSSSGTILDTQPVPADLPMRCAFGDEGLSSFYLSDARGNLYRAKDIGRTGMRR